MKRTKFHPSMLILFSAIIVVFTFAGRSRSIGDPSRSRSIGDPVKDDISKMELQSKEAFQTGDSALFVKCYTPDACAMIPNAPLLCGPQGIAQFFKGACQMGVKDATYTSLGLFGQTSEYVTQQGIFELFDGAQHSLRKGKVLLLWKKTSEGWKMFRESLNFDAAPAPASSPN